MTADDRLVIGVGVMGMFEPSTDRCHRVGDMNRDKRAGNHLSAGDPDALGVAVGGGQRQLNLEPPPSSCGVILGSFGSPTTSVYRWLLKISSTPPVR